MCVGPSSHTHSPPVHTIEARPLARSNNDAGLAFDGIALGSYRVEWASNLSGGLWNTLLITNVPAAGGLLQVTDHGAFTNQPLRFYCVQTPP
jgi:hypothetical protein